jgi:hypothetical protein
MAEILLNDLRQVDGFFPDTPVSSTNKSDRNDITEILLKEALNTIKPTNQPNQTFYNVNTIYNCLQMLIQLLFS